MYVAYTPAPRPRTSLRYTGAWMDQVVGQVRQVLHGRGTETKRQHNHDQAVCARSELDPMEEELSRGRKGVHLCMTDPNQHAPPCIPCRDGLVIRYPAYTSQEGGFPDTHAAQG